MPTSLTDRRVAALDIETYSPTVPDGEYPDFEDPGDFSMLATALAFQEAGTPPDAGPDRAEVLFREDGCEAAERDHGRAVHAALSAFDPEVLVTFNGDRFDRVVLPGRMDRAGAESVGEDLRALFDGCAGLDLKHAAWERYGRYTSLEALCRHEGLAVTETRWDAYDLPGDLGAVVEGASEPYVTSADVARLGEPFMAARGRGDRWDAVEALLTDYALADVEPLFTLAGRHPF